MIRRLPGSVLAMGCVIFATLLPGQQTRGAVIGTEWIQTQSELPDRDIRPVAQFVDSAQQVTVVAGRNGLTDEQYLIYRYDASAAVVWLQHYGGSDSCRAQPYAAAVNAQGQVYVAGLTGGCSGDSLDCTTIKLDTDGYILWERHYNGPGDSLDMPRAMVVTPDGSAYVLIWSYDDSTAMDVAVVKYSTNGDFVREWRYNRPGENFDEPIDLTVDDSGNVYVAALTGSALDYTTIKFDTAGSLAWDRHYNGTGDGTDRPEAIGRDGAGNIVVTGESFGDNLGHDFVTLKYSPDGTLLWERRLEQPVQGSGHPRAMVVDTNGDVYITGFTDSISVITTLKYHANGDLAWHRQYDDTASLVERAEDVQIDTAGNVFVTGFVESDTNEYSDYITLQYDSLGTLIREKRFGPVGDLDDQGKAIDIDPYGYVYVTGISYGTPPSWDYACTTIKYELCTVLLLGGDVDDNGLVNSADIIYMVNYLFKGGPAPLPEARAGDVNCDVNVTSADALTLINFVFKGGVPPCVHCRD